MKKSYLIVLGCLLGLRALGQWTEPDTTACPQFGTGIRTPWISNDRFRLYLCTLSTVNITSRLTTEDPWSPLSTLPPHINATGTQGSACESPSGDTLYFISDSDQRPEGGSGWLDVYYSIRTDTGWGPAINCGPNVNGPGQEWSVGISRDGGMLLVSSHGPLIESISHDLYYSMKQPDGSWGMMQSFGTAINTSDDENNPSLSPDGSRLFFCRVGPNGGDIYESHLVNSVWQTATSLPAPINTPETEMNPCMDPDGRTLWFRHGLPQAGFWIYASVDTSVLFTDEADSCAADNSQMLECFPNPFNSSTTIEFAIPKTAEVAICVFDILGRDVGMIAKGNFSAGSHSILWDGSALASGIYFIRLDAETLHATHKMMLLK